MNTHTKTPSWSNHPGLPVGGIVNETLKSKSKLIGRVATMLLAYGAGAWRIKESINTMAEQLELTCTVSLGLRSIEYTCYSKTDSCTHILNITNTGIDGFKLFKLEQFVTSFADYLNRNLEQTHSVLDSIEHFSSSYTIRRISIWTGIACGSFVFLLGGGPVEMVCSFFGAMLGQSVRKKMIQFHITLTLSIIASVSAACISYGVLLYILCNSLNISFQNQAGYLGAILFIVPGFPFISGFLDISKLYIRSGFERLAYSFYTMATATLCAWVIATLLNLKPEEFISPHLDPISLILFRLITSYLGVYGFSVGFNNTCKMSLVAALIGAISNTVRLELIDLAHLPMSLSALTAAMIAGILASIYKQSNGASFPRLTLTVPSVIIMVPGSFVYRGVYFLANNQLRIGQLWLVEAIFVLFCLPLGLLLARIISDKSFRHCT